MKKKILHYAKEIALFFLVMTVLANAISYYKSTDLDAEAFRINSLQLINAKEFAPEAGKAILVHFWATWCPTCKLEAANIERISKEYQVLSIAVKSGSDEEVQEYLNEHALDFDTYNDADASLAREYNIGAYPTTFIYDKDKNLVFSEVGYTSTIGLYLRMWWAEL